MLADSQRLLKEFDTQYALIRHADEIVLYGRTDVLPVMDMALKEMNVTVPYRLFDGGHFSDGDMVTPQKRVVILCGMRAKTRESMRIDAGRYFPNVVCIDFLAIYYHWLTACVKRDCDKEELAKTVYAVRDERTIHNIDSINTSYCNLNCRECSNGMQVRKDKKIVAIDRHIESLRRLTDIMPISYCNIQGGEPLLDRELSKRLLLHASNPRIAFLTLATNGTIAPDDSVMESMRKTGIMLRISDYGELSKNKHLLMQKAKRFSVPCDTYHRAETWVSYGEFVPHQRTEKENKEIANSCHFGTKDLMLYDGRLYCCCRTLFANAAGVENEAVIRNTLDCRDSFSFSDLEEIVRGDSLHLMCDYCSYPMKNVKVAAQTVSIKA